MGFTVNEKAGNAPAPKAFRLLNLDNFSRPGGRSYRIITDSVGATSRSRSKNAPN
jgi:hypothetical protein